VFVPCWMRCSGGFKVRLVVLIDVDASGLPFGVNDREQEMIFRIIGVAGRVGVAFVLPPGKSLPFRRADDGGRNTTDQIAVAVVFVAHAAA